MMLPCQVNDERPHRGEMNSECLAVAGLVPVQMRQDTPSQLLTPDPATRHAKSPGFNLPCGNDRIAADPDVRTWVRVHMYAGFGLTVEPSAGMIKTRVVARRGAVRLLAFLRADDSCCQAAGLSVFEDDDPGHTGCCFRPG
jgi:hypothetical protein